jgi:transcriptional regulator with XRE-family HTH domain
MELPERIATIMKVNQHTPASFADVLGVQRSSISHVLNGRNKPSMDFIQKILENFPRVDAKWLITGLEPQAVSEAKEESKKVDTIKEITSSVSASAKKTNQRQIERIVIFYTDRTFETYESK